MNYYLVENDFGNREEKMHSASSGAEKRVGLKANGTTELRFTGRYFIYENHVLVSTQWRSNSGAYASLKE